jgi:hypothetical protein
MADAPGSCRRSAAVDSIQTSLAWPDPVDIVLSGCAFPTSPPLRSRRTKRIPEPA